MVEGCREVDERRKGKKLEKLILSALPLNLEFQGTLYICTLVRCVHMLTHNTLSEYLLFTVHCARRWGRPSSQVSFSCMGNTDT